MLQVDRGGSGPPCSETSVSLEPSVESVSNVFDYPRNDDRGEKVKMTPQKTKKNSVQQTTDREQPTKSAANQHRVREVIYNALLVNGQSAASLRGHLQCIVGEIMSFPNLKTRTSD